MNSKNPKIVLFWQDFSFFLYIWAVLSPILEILMETCCIIFFLEKNFASVWMKTVESRIQCDFRKNVSLKILKTNFIRFSFSLQTSVQIFQSHFWNLKTIIFSIFFFFHNKSSDHGKGEIHKPKKIRMFYLLNKYLYQLKYNIICVCVVYTYDSYINTCSFYYSAYVII